ncbi:GGDEF domain-containing protein [Lichenihabitans sp. Uapishka_5]|uniref:GGDEF domain-containing protein n=1 Tax=Lichenihabitans sp. Uapishka_5 TaxID=3037302 RepID=UPI0029E7E12D|nr:GGDEF domain-containing protein [Lichenihabitans sp. Uapishka_5]MDX7951026.1 GGDEF domain-containing protein [Lichenihabitans sp. Uapishka_5]
MAIDAPTLLLLTLAISLIAAAFLFFEWRAIGDPALILWSAGFAAIVVGCSLSPLRYAASPLLGVWFANGLLIVAHLLFLRGTTVFTGRHTTLLWWALLAPWGLLLLVPIDAAHSGIFGRTNAMLVCVLSLWTAWLALSVGAADLSSRRFGAVFLAHGAFYAIKTALISAPGAFIDMMGYKGLLIQLSLFEGILVEVLLALLMAAAVRRRREEHTATLAERDPLTGLLNRRAFRERAAALLPCPGMLLLLDVDHFKAVNDTAGHAAGDRLLVALAEGLLARLPQGAVAARFGGDEFIALAPDLDGVELSVIARVLRADLAIAGASFLPPGLAATLSIGASRLTDATGLDALMDRADAALYEAKRGGRDRLALAP